jgi:serine/threonine-protein kinase
MFDHGVTHDGIPFITMELLEGEDLARRSRRVGRPSPPEVATIVLQAGKALSKAHERGIVHRDIKPGNIMLQPRGQAKIMDFGLARMRVADHKTSTGMVLGTPKYMSPEQVAGQPVDPRSDIFSLGIVLYEMATGVRLFAGADATQIMHNVVNAEHEPPTRVNPALPAMLDFIVARALKKNAAQRYQDVYELSADLATCLAELRGRDPAEASSQATKTVKLGAEKAPPAPAAQAIGADTRLPLSRQFDSSAALQRLADLARADPERLARAPRGVGILRRLYSDPPARLLFLTIVASALAGGYIGFY